MAVAHGGPGAVVTALLADDLADLLLHQFGQDTEPDADRQGQKPLLGDAHQRPKRLLHPWRQRTLIARDGLHGRYVSLHGGSPFDLSNRPEGSHWERTEREDRRPQVLRATGQPLPTCLGTVGGVFDPERHLFRNSTVAEVATDLRAFIDTVRGLNRSVRFIITVSPVPLVATASGQHVLAATMYSKFVLRVAANEVAGSHASVTYFPAYELVTGPQAPESFFEADRRSVTRPAVEQVMTALLDASNVTPPRGQDQPGGKDLGVRTEVLSATEIGRSIAEAECDEVLLDAWNDELPSQPHEGEASTS